QGRTETEGRIPFRLRIGVTGHRDLDDREDIAQRVRVWLTTIRDRFPATATTPVIFEVLSSLAEGADRLVVQEATRVLANAGRLDVQAVLPLPTAEYTQDFRSERSIEEFERLVEKASLAPPFPRAASREAAYERAGRYVVDHSDVL